jgi:outer membrane lipoprotein carrier protein
LRCRRDAGAFSGAPVESKSMMLFFVFLALAALQGQSTDNVADAVSGLQRRYANVQTIAASFQQSYRAAGIEQTESGVFWMKKPGLMRWEYQKPESKLFIADGVHFYLYLPEERQVQIRAFSRTELHNTPLQFLLGRGEIQKSFAVSRETELQRRIPGSILLRLEPRDSQQEYSHLTLECDSKTYELRRIVIHERLGSTSELLFSDMKTNVKIDAKKFKLEIPKNAEVIRLEEK